jgi:hypothetical protein
MPRRNEMDFGQQTTLVAAPKMSGRKKLLIVGSDLAPPRGKIAIRQEMCAKATARWNSYLLELLDGTLVDTAALVDQMTCYVCERDARVVDRGLREAYRWWWTCQNRRGR